MWTLLIAIYLSGGGVTITQIPGFKSFEQCMEQGHIAIHVFANDNDTQEMSRGVCLEVK